jgi:hypothetical protein
MEIETDPHRLAQRQKQIDIGKSSIVYKAYEECRRNPNEKVPYIPIPNIHVKRAKRSFDGLVTQWKKRLHAWYEEKKERRFIPTQYRCVQCSGQANFREDNGSLLFFCAKECQERFYSGI